LKRCSLPGAEQDIRHVLDAFPFYVLLVDSGHNILAANGAVRRDFGLNAEKLIGAYCPAVLHGCSEPIAECPLTEAIKSGNAIEREVFEAGSARWVNSAVYPTSLVASDGKPVYLHLVRDITEAKNTASELSRSLEHHKTLCNLLLSLESCQNSVQVLETLIDRMLSLSWLGVASKAIGFLVKEKSLEMVARRNVNPRQLERCRSLAVGECLCGKAAVSGRIIVGSSVDAEHNIRYEGIIAHGHVVMPLSHEDRVLGVLNFYLNPGDTLDPFRLGFLEAASAAAAAVLAEQLAREEVKRTRERCMAQIISSQEDDRKRIAVDLHEQLGQSLSALLLNIQLHSCDDEPSKLIKDDCEARIRNLIDHVHQMAKQLRPTILDDYGLELALARHIEELSARTALAIDYQYVASPEREGRLTTPVEIGLYRVAMEALSNVVEHAAATRVSVIVVCQRDKILLLVEDDGCGFDYSAIRKDIEHCLGLIGMEERIALLGGTLKLESIPQKGTTLSAEIPIETTR
jgi:PAS domain S-box-containing protein